MFRHKGIRPKLVKMDNEVSKQMVNWIETDAKLQYQLVSPGNHRTNYAERAIQTFKAHLIAILSGTDPSFPSDCWDLLLEQTVITLNMLRQSRQQPQLSAYAQVHGQFDFNKTPMAPLGCKVMIHSRPQQRAAWADHCVEGYYIGPAMQHYQNYSCH